MIRVQNLNINISASGVPLVKDVNFELGPGKVLGLVGESGSGKTTISLALLGYSKPGTSIADGAEVHLGDIDILSLGDRARSDVRGRLVSYVPQDPSASLNPAIRIGNQLTEGLTRGKDALGALEATARVAELLAEVGLPDSPEFLTRYPSQLSGGQLQRVAIAMAVARHPRLVVMDEPTTGLDVSTQTEVLAMMRRLFRTHGIAAVYVSHDLAVVAHIADQVIVLYAGRIVESDVKRSIFSQAAHPYTQSLLDAVPSIREAKSLRAIAGKAPSLAERDQGCVFRPRCAHAVSICGTVPRLRELGENDHLVACHRAGENDLRQFHAPPILPRRASDGPPILEFQSVSAGYGDRQVLRDVSISLKRGECLAIVGESGSGKTTLSRCLIGLHHNWAGTMLFNGRPLARSAGRRRQHDRQKLQYVFQNPYGSLNPRKTIGGNLAVPLRHFQQASGPSINQSIQAVLERVELRSSYIDRFPSELSGGEKQRVAIARALLASPELMICDEITSALDVSVQAAIVELLRSLMGDGLSLVFVTHNLGVVRSLADRVAVLNLGEIVEFDDTDRVFGKPAADYTKALLANTLELA